MKSIPIQHEGSWFSRRIAGLLRVLVEGIGARDKPAAGERLDLIAWGQRYLPRHFAKPPSPLHRWLADQADAMRTTRGLKVNLIGPRGAAKSTVGTLAAVLRAAVEGREPYIWVVSDTHGQAKSHLDNLKTELTDNRVLRAAYPAATGPPRWWRSASVRLSNGVVIEAFRHRAEAPRPPGRAPPADADRLRRPAERPAHRLGPPARL